MYVTFQHQAQIALNMQKLLDVLLIFALGRLKANKICSQKILERLRESEKFWCFEGLEKVWNFAEGQKPLLGLGWFFCGIFDWRNMEEFFQRICL